MHGRSASAWEWTTFVLVTLHIGDTDFRDLSGLRFIGPVNSERQTDWAAGGDRNDAYRFDRSDAPGSASPRLQDGHPWDANMTNSAASLAQSRLDLSSDGRQR